MTKKVARVAALGAVLLAGSNAVNGTKERVDLKKWIEGPVRYITTHDEVKTFRALASDAERTSFIDVFWRRRDATPETSDNEYRRLFWARVKAANDNFVESATPGWKSDRGRLHILCGPPTRIETDVKADVSSTSPTASHGLIRWIYEGSPCGRSDVGPVFVVPFVQSVSGEYRLSYNPRLSTFAFNARDLSDPSRLAIERWLDVVAPSDRSELAAMLDLGKLQEAPHPEEILLDRVETIEAYGSHALAVEVDRFRHPHGGTLAVITVLLPGGEQSAPALMARLTPRDATRPSRFVTEESFRIEGTGDARVSQARLLLEPGLYDLTVLSAGGASNTTGLFKSTVEVPGAEERMRLSDVVLARSLEPLAFASLVSYDEPYFVGVFRVVPRVARSVPRAETVHFFHEVYGGTAPFRVSYELEGMEDDGRFTPLGKPAVQEQAGASHAWAITVGPTWPTGDYRVRIRVQDSRNVSAEALAAFKVVSP